MPRIIGFDAQLLAQTALHIISVLLVIYILYRLLFNPIRKLLAERTERISNDLSEAANQKEAALKLRTEYEEKLANINQEADEIIREAHKKALNKEKATIAKAKEEADRLLTRAQLDIEREQLKAKDDIKKEIVGIATLMASKFVESSMSERVRHQLLDESIKEMGDTTWLH